jgi:hypothetical protein
MSQRVLLLSVTCFGVGETLAVTWVKGNHAVSRLPASSPLPCVTASLPQVDVIPSSFSPLLGHVEEGNDAFDGCCQMPENSCS